MHTFDILRRGRLAIGRRCAPDPGAARRPFARAAGVSAWALVVAWAAAVASLALAGLAQAQTSPRIDGVDVERVAALADGTRLNFSVFGSAGAQVQLQIDGARRPLTLRELQPGVYDGTYVLEAGEQIAPDARVTATLRLHGQEARALLDEPLLLGDAPVPARRPVDTPQASPQWPPPPPSQPPPVTRPAPDTPPFETPPPPRPIAWPPARATDPPPEARGNPTPCTECAIVESIRPLPAETHPPASRPGTLLGGLFGDRVGAAVDRHVARVTGAIDRAVHGRSLDETPGPGVEVVLRLPNGQRLVRIYDRAPELRVGDLVRRDTSLGGARSERLLDAPSPSSVPRPAPRGERLAGPP